MEAVSRQLTVSRAIHHTALETECILLIHLVKTIVEYYTKTNISTNQKISPYFLSIKYYIYLQYVNLQII